MLLSPADLVYVRAEAEGLLPDTCAIQQRQLTADTLGGFTEAWVAAYQDVPCRLAESQARQGEGMWGARESADNLWTLTLAYDQAIAGDDRIYHAGLTYEVVFVNTERSYDTVRRVQLRRLA